MCGLCGSFAAGHWSDGFAGGATPTADRVRRAEVANETLALYGLTLRHWAGRYTLTSRTGRAAVVESYGALWPAAERLSGRTCDPLDEDLLRLIEDAGRRDSRPTSCGAPPPSHLWGGVGGGGGLG